MVALFAVSCLMRRDNPANPSSMAVALSAAAVVLGAVTGWLGGELVDRPGVGVDEGANLNAPRSLETDRVRPRRAA